MAHPHAYDWHDGHTGHHTPLALAKADGMGKPHPHMDTPPTPTGPQPHPTNDQAAGVGVSTYAQFAKPYGEIHPGHKSDLNFYPMHGKLDAVKNLVGAHGYQTYYAGGQFGKPDLASKNYNTKHLMVYDPTPDSGASFGDQEYTDAWRNIHELAHANVYPELNSIYGEGRRIGKLGMHRTLHEAKRAVHWEWLAAHRQRQLAESIGIKIPDEAFHKELNTVMHDAVHRAVTGKFTEPSGEGFVPHTHKVPLQQAMSLLDEAARNLGLHNPHQLLRKSEDSMTIDPTVAEKLRVGILGQLKKAVAELETHYSDMREREMRKSEMEKCGDMSKPVAKGELKDAKTVPSYEAKPDKPKDDSVLPGDKKSKDLSDKDTGAGGQLKKIRKAAMAMAKSDVPMAKPPTKSPTAPPSTSKPAPAPAAPPAATGTETKKAEVPMAKAGPRLGGKDMMSQAMTNDAAKAGMGAPAAPKIPGRAPKMSQEDHARRAAEMAAFTPSGAFSEPKGQGAAAGAMKPGAPASSGLELAPKAPAPKSPGIKIPGRG